MKLTKLILAAAAAAGFCAFQASASSFVGTTLTNDNLSVSITVVTNKPYTYTPANETYHYTTGTVNAGNKQLLELFAKWNGIDRSTDANWKTAKLVVAWDWDGDVLVVDKTGTNVLFDATTGTNDASFYVRLQEDGGAYTETSKESTPESYSYKENYYAEYELYDDTYSPYIYIYGDGGNNESFSANLGPDDEKPTWSDSEDAIFPLEGDQYFFDAEGSAKAVITLSGHGKGYNYYLGDF